jgi:hypothetical protein
VALIEPPSVPSTENPVAQSPVVAITQTLCYGLFQNPSLAVEVDDTLHVSPVYKVT